MPRRQSGPVIRSSVAGLGLPKALRLVEANGGSLRITSQPGRGTQCTLMLPLASGPGTRSGEGREPHLAGRQT